MSSYTAVFTDDGSGNFIVEVKRAPTTDAAGGTNLTLPPFPNANAGTSSVTISGATNAAPIVLTVPAGHGVAVGDMVTVKSVGGNTAANGTFRCSAQGATTVTLGNSAGNGAYTSGGTLVEQSTVKQVGIAVQAALTAIQNDRAAGN